MEMEVGKVKVKLQALITEARQLRDKERLSSDQFQKWKQEEQAFGTKIRLLEADLASSIQVEQQLHRKVHFLEDENHLHQTNLKQLNQTIHDILEAKEAFLTAYQESTCQFQCSIRSQDTKIAMLSRTVDSHLASLDSIREHASSINQLVDNAHRLVADREELVARLKIQMYKVCELERLLIEKNNDLEAKLKSKEDEFHRKERVIAELQAQLETTKITHQFPSKIEELQEALQMKQGIIETLISENKALRSELGMLEVSFKIIQDSMTHMDEEDIIVLANQEKDDRMNHDIENCEANYHHDASRVTAGEIADIPCKEHAHIAIPLRENNNVHSCVSESTFSPSHSVHSESQPVANASNVGAAEDQDNRNTCIQQLDSECSTTQAGT